MNRNNLFYALLVPLLVLSMACGKALPGIPANATAHDFAHGAGHWWSPEAENGKDVVLQTVYDEDLERYVLNVSTVLGGPIDDQLKWHTEVRLDLQVAQNLAGKKLACLVQVPTTWSQVVVRSMAADAEFDNNLSAWVLAQRLPRLFTDNAGNWRVVAIDRIGTTQEVGPNFDATRVLNIVLRMEVTQQFPANQQWAGDVRFGGCYVWYSMHIIHLLSTIMYISLSLSTVR